MNQHTDLAAVVGVLGVVVIACAALWLGKADGVLVASAAVGGICGWLARSGGRTANIEHAESVQGGPL